MLPQYLAQPRSPRVQIAAFRPQHISLGRYVYIFTPESSILTPGYCQVAWLTIVGQARSMDLVPTAKNYWRKTCRTVSKLCWPSGWLHWLPLAQTQRLSKNTSWLTPRRSRKSRLTPVNTSKITLTGWRAAIRPAVLRNLPPREDAIC